MAIRLLFHHRGNQIATLLSPIVSASPIKMVPSRSTCSGKIGVLRKGSRNPGWDCHRAGDFSGANDSRDVQDNFTDGAGPIHRSHPPKQYVFGNRDPRLSTATVLLPEFFTGSKNMVARISPAVGDFTLPLSNHVPPVTSRILSDQAARHLTGWTN